MQPALLVLAAGMGARYGGLKQFERVGPGGETLLDYAVFDAIRAGFGRVVFVIRGEFEAEFRDKVGANYAGRIAVDYVLQAIETLPAGSRVPAGREKPWGTGHAVWCAREAVRENFAAINADDFYGAEALQRLGDFLRDARGSEFAMAGFRLANTLSEHGTVARGVCRVGGDGRIESIVEHTGIAAGDVGAGRKFSGDETVSMNCWGFTPAVFAGLERGLCAFLRAAGLPVERGEGAAPPLDPMKAEFYLPAAVSEMIAGGEANVRVLPTAGEWFGVTYREDQRRVVAAIAELVRRGVYPAKLF